MLALAKFWAGLFFVWGLSCALQVLHSFLEMYQLDTNSTLPLVTTKSVSRHYQCPLGKHCPSLKTIALDRVRGTFELVAQ